MDSDDGARLGVLAAGNANAPSFPLLVSLRSAEPHDDSSARKLQVPMVEADKLRAPERASEAKQEEGSIAEVEQSPTLAATPRRHRAQILDECWRFALLRGAACCGLRSQRAGLY
jgi:hypothetical protein